MDDDVPKDTPASESDADEAARARRSGDAGAPGGAPEPGNPFNKIDLSQLQGFSFGTQWTQDKPAPGEARQRDDRRPRREGRPGQRPGDVPADRRDRRAFRRPDAPPGGPGAGTGEPSGGAAASRRGPSDGAPERRPRPEGPGYGPQRTPGAGRPAHHEPRVPYESPFFSVTFYPEDNSFNALVKTVRASCRTIELFEIARTVLAKPERFTVLLTRKDPSDPRTSGVPGRQPPPPDESAERAAPAGPPKEPIYISAPDALPFEDEEAAIAHVLSKHLKLFFETTEAEVEPPKGNFQVINRCGVTGELLGPPNYHRYNQIVQQHYAARNIRMPFEAYRSRIETVRDPEAVNQWLEKMKRVTRYTWKGHTPEGQTPPSFDNWEDARSYLLTQTKDKVVRSAGHARFHGREVETLPAGEIRRAIESALERQRRFPLDTANALRGRLRREHFTIFKKGAKGISYVCAVKRKFRTPGQTFAHSIGALIGFIEAHPMVKAGELPRRFLGVTPEAAGETPAADPGAALASVLTVEQRERVARMQGDLLWLVREGYVTEFIDGGLYAPPPMVEARKKEVEREEHDPENFPEPSAEGVGGSATPEAPAEESAAPEAQTDPGAAPEAAPPEPTPTEGAAPTPIGEPEPGSAPSEPDSSSASASHSGGSS